MRRGARLIVFKDFRIKNFAIESLKLNPLSKYYDSGG